MIRRVQRAWQLRHRGVSRWLEETGDVYPAWEAARPRMAGCPPVGGKITPPYEGQPCGVAGCPWCAARAAQATYRLLIDAYFPRRPGGVRQPLARATLWLRQLRDVVGGYYTDGDETRHGLVDAAWHRARDGGQTPRCADYRRFAAYRSGSFGYFERISPH